MRILSTFSLTLITLTGLAGEKVDQSLDFVSDGTVDISNVRGDVDIIGWDKTAVRVEGELDDLTEEFVFETSGNRVTIEVKLPRKNVTWGDGSDLEIHVPQASRVSFKGVSTDVDVSGVTGGTRLDSVSGDVSAADLTGQILIRAVSGGIEVTDSSGEAQISTVSGDVRLRMSTRELDIDTVSGELDVRLAEFDAVRADLVSGDFNLSGQLASDGELEVTGVSGEIDLSLAGSVNAEVSAKTGPGGSIVNRWSSDRASENFISAQELSTSIGNGSGHINIRTVSGDIRLDRDD